MVACMHASKEVDIRVETVNKCGQFRHSMKRLFEPKRICLKKERKRSSVCVYVCMHIYIYMYICVHLCIYTYVCVRNISSMSSSSLECGVVVSLCESWNS